MTVIKLKPDTWTIIGAAPAGNITFQNQTRGIAWFTAADALPTGVPVGIEYASLEGESGRSLLDIFGSDGANLYAYSQLGGPVSYSAAP